MRNRIQPIALSTSLFRSQYVPVFYSPQCMESWKKNRRWRACLLMQSLTESYTVRRLCRILEKNRSKGWRFLFGNSNRIFEELSNVKLFQQPHASSTRVFRLWNLSTCNASPVKIPHRDICNLQRVVIFGLSSLVRAKSWLPLVLKFYDRTLEWFHMVIVYISAVEDGSLALIELYGGGFFSSVIAWMCGT